MRGTHHCHWLGYSHHQPTKKQQMLFMMVFLRRNLRKRESTRATLDFCRVVVIEGFGDFGLDFVGVVIDVGVVGIFRVFLGGFQ